MAKDIILCGMDGVLANPQHRQHFIAKQRCAGCLDHSFFTSTKCGVCGNSGWEKVGKKEHAAYEAACSNDAPQQTTIELLKLLRNSMHAQLREPQVWILTGRSNAVFAQTEAWLKQNLVPATHILMRKPHDERPEEELKRTWMRDATLIDRERIFCVIDHLPESVAMWREEGLTCYQANV
jgi:hypothetical protein